MLTEELQEELLGIADRLGGVADAEHHFEEACATWVKDATTDPVKYRVLTPLISFWRNFLQHRTWPPSMNVDEIKEMYSFFSAEETFVDESRATEFCRLFRGAFFTKKPLDIVLWSVCSRGLLYDPAVTQILVNAISHLGADAAHIACYVVPSVVIALRIVPFCNICGIMRLLACMSDHPMAIEYLNDDILFRRMEMHINHEFTININAGTTPALVRSVASLIHYDRHLSWNNTILLIPKMNAMLTQKCLMSGTCNGIHTLCMLFSSYVKDDALRVFSMKACLTMIDIMSTWDEWYEDAFLVLILPILVHEVLAAQCIVYLIRTNKIARMVELCTGKMTAGSRDSQLSGWSSLLRVLHSYTLPPSGPARTTYACPITLEPCVDPVIASDGHTYERYAIVRHMAANACFSPMTRLPIEWWLVTNFALCGNGASDSRLAGRSKLEGHASRPPAVGSTCLDRGRRCESE